jgi:hypothetical protein
VSGPGMLPEIAASVACMTDMLKDLRETEVLVPQRYDELSGSLLAFLAAFIFVRLGQAYEQCLKFGTLLLRRAFAVCRGYVQAPLAVGGTALLFPLRWTLAPASAIAPLRLLSRDTMA